MTERPDQPTTWRGNVIPPDQRPMTEVLGEEIDALRAERDQLAAQVATLRATLEPFAALGAKWRDPRSPISLRESVYEIRATEWDDAVRVLAETGPGA